MWKEPQLVPDSCKPSPHAPAASVHGSCIETPNHYFNFPRHDTHDAIGTWKLWRRMSCCKEGCAAHDMTTDTCTPNAHPKNNFILILHISLTSWHHHCSNMLSPTISRIRLTVPNDSWGVRSPTLSSGRNNFKRRDTKVLYLPIYSTVQSSPWDSPTWISQNYPSLTYF